MNPDLKASNTVRDSAFAESYDAAMQMSSEDMAAANTSLELLEQHQAKEQARLLQRFRELRQWQQQQQQQLMLQQQHQLKAWQDEQSKVQSLIATQRGLQKNQPKGFKLNAGGSRSPVMTPPSKPRIPSGNNAHRDVESVSQSQGAGNSLDSGLVASMQDTLKSQSTLPRPVMYVDPSKVLNPNDEDRYTSSELFSNPGSHDDQLDILRDNNAHPAPDWMSDTSENFVPPKLPPPRPGRGGLSDQLAGLEHLLTTAPAGLLQQVLNLLPGNVGNRAPPSRSADDVELSASPTLPGPGQPPRARKLQYQPPPPPQFSTTVTSLPQQQPQQQHRHQKHSQQPQQQNYGQRSMMNGLQSFSLGPPVMEPEQDPRFIPRALVLDDDNMSEDDKRQGVEENGDENDEEWEDQDDDDNDDEEGSDRDEDNSNQYDDDQNITAKEVKDTGHEDRPITGTASKTFEQLLEEQLRQEEEKMRLASQEESDKQKKMPFLKKGEGISRFNSAPKKPPKRSSGTSSRKTHHTQENGRGKEAAKSKSDAGEKPVQKAEGGEGNKKSSVASRLKDMSKVSGNSKPMERKVKNSTKTTPRPPETSSAEKPAAKLQLIHSVANKKLEEQRSRQREGVAGKFQRAELDHIDLFRNGGVEKSPSLDSRSHRSDDHDSTELDSLAEFELLEDAVDNMSFCSNSSLVRKLVTNDKQGHKEAMNRLKTISETKKTDTVKTGGTNPASSHTSTETVNKHSLVDEDGYFKKRMDDIAMASYNNNNNSNNNTKDCNNNINNNNIHVTKPSSDSSDVTLTDSSDEDNGYNNSERVKSDKCQDENISPRGGMGVSSLPPSSQAMIMSNPPQSPSKVMTRKVAPMASKFTAANDTLSVLKALSIQAGLLTSGTAPPSSSESTVPFFSLQSGTTSTSTTVLPNSVADNAALGLPAFTASSASSSHHSILPNQSFLPTSQQFSGFSTLPSDFKPNPFSLLDGALSQTSTAFTQNSWSDSNPVISNVPFMQLPGQSGHPFSTGNTVGDAQEKSYNRHQYRSQMDKDSDESEDNDGDDDGSEDNDEDSDENEDKAEMKDNKVMNSDHRSVKQTSSEERKTPQGAEPPAKPAIAFDDETAWVDDDDDENETCLKAVAGPASASATTTAPDSTPPTSKLVSRLFPKLKPKPSAESEKANQSLQQASAQPIQSSDGVQSRILREKLMELDTEIERFRSENANLEKLRREREEGLAKLKQEIENFQKEKEEELKRLEEFKAEEMKKLKREKKLFDSYQKKVRSMPDKKEREEIEALKTQLQELQDEMKRKESRWNASTARLKNRVAEVELENGELKEEVRILEKKRLEWMTAQNNVKSVAPLSNGKVGHMEGGTGKSGPLSSREPTASQPRSSTPTQESDKVKYSNSGGQKSSFPSTTSAGHLRSAVPKVTPANQSAGKVNRNNPGSNHVHNGSVVPASSGVHNGPESAIPKVTAVLKPPAPPTVHANMSGESMQAQNNSVPVMIENTLPIGTQGSGMPGSLASSMNPCDKSAALTAMERAVIDKGDVSAFVETMHQDGKVEKTYKTGAKEIHFPNGTVKEISADGQTIVCRLANGDIRQIFPDHRVVYIFAEAEIMQTTFPDGLETFQFKNGQIERRYPDGTVEITFPSKDVKYLFPDGGQEVILTDGTVMQYSSKGERTVEYPSGDREVHTAEYQRREFPDGIVKTIYSDGRHETRFPNGRVRMRDKAGNVIMDQIVYR